MPLLTPKLLSFASGAISVPPFHLFRARWKGAKYTDKTLALLSKRLKELVTPTSTHPALSAQLNFTSEVKKFHNYLNVEIGIELATNCLKSKLFDLS
jgi:hypothetical protein